MNDFTLLMEPETHCSHCRKSEKSHWLFIHEESGCRVCQDCLGDYLREDIRVQDIGYFEGFEFTQNGYEGRFQVVNDEFLFTGNTIHDCVEMVLMKLNLI